MLVRRHHCRICGKIFCWRCCDNWVAGTEFNYDRPIRVCNYCFRLQLAQAEKSPSPSDSVEHEPTGLEESEAGTFSDDGSEPDESTARTEGSIMSAEEFLLKTFQQQQFLMPPPPARPGTQPNTPTQARLHVASTAPESTTAAAAGVLNFSIASTTTTPPTVTPALLMPPPTRRSPAVVQPRRRHSHGATATAASTPPRRSRTTMRVATRRCTARCCRLVARNARRPTSNPRPPRSGGNAGRRADAPRCAEITRPVAAVAVAASEALVAQTATATVEAATRYANAAEATVTVTVAMPARRRRHLAPRLAVMVSVSRFASRTRSSTFPTILACCVVPRSP